MPILTLPVKLNDDGYMEYLHDGLDLVYFPGFYTSKIADEYLEYLLDLEYDSPEDSQIMIYGKKMQIPRRQVAHGDSGITYRFSGNTVKARPWSQTLRNIKFHIDQFTSFSKVICDPGINFVLVNKYRNGKDVIGFHTDDEGDLKSTNIISLSFGASRTFRFRRISNKTEQYDIILNHGDLIIMRGDTNKLWQHSLPKRMKVSEPRVNLTYRSMYA